MRLPIPIALALLCAGLLGAQEELPRRFRDLQLGMSLEELKIVLAEDSIFSFRGDRDVSFLPDPRQSLVETTGLSFIKRAFFQFHGEGLFIMAFSMNTGLIDYYSIFTALREKYGEPKELSPRQSVWEDGGVRLALERPLTVKYIDLEVFNGIVEASTAENTHELLRRQEFIDAF
jgi:hypothetical protein